MLSQILLNSKICSDERNVAASPIVKLRGYFFVKFEDVFALMILIMLLKIVKVSREIMTRNQSKIYESDILRLFSRVF